RSAQVTAPLPYFELILSSAWLSLSVRVGPCLAARSRGSRSSSEAIVKRLEGSTRSDPARLARWAAAKSQCAHARLHTRMARTPIPFRAPSMDRMADAADGCAGRRSDRDVAGTILEGTYAGDER